MRPVDRGPVPQDGGQDVMFTEYGQARPYLARRLGRYCSYCERWMAASLAVEHVRPKSLRPDLALCWENLLVACANCNSAKGDTPIDLGDYYWPDTDNTGRALAYAADGSVKPSAALSPDAAERATRTISLTGLDSHPASDRKPSADDYRWFDRVEAWDQATRCLRGFEQQRTRPETVADVMRGRGLWSVWMEVFHAHPAVRRALIDALPGTAPDCFDSDGNPIPRPGGDL
jgi:uncharacterized protein (TIGR02646 family)